MNSCTDIFHKECLVQYLVSKIGGLPITCPSQTCRSELLMEDIRQILDDEQIEKLEKFTFNKLVD